MDIYIAIVLGWLGALLGSFACAQVWRLRARQLLEDEGQGEKIDHRELKRLKGLVRPVSGDRSECLHCHHRLAWYDLIPLVSWLTLGGKCRYCRREIGWLEPIVELGLAVTFVVSYFAWPYSLVSIAEIGLFTLWLIACTLMAILVAYDGKWSLLPFRINIALIVVSALFAGLRWGIDGVSGVDVLSLVVALLILAGLYRIFAQFGWAGEGDSILGVGLALLLGRWELAFLALFLANLLGCFALVPLAMRRQLKRNIHIPFGPFLIVATVISLFWGDFIIGLFFASSNSMLTTLML